MGIWSKNRGHKRSYVYQIDAAEQDLVPQDSLRLQSMITAGDFHAPSQTLALLGYGRIYFLKWSEGKWQPEDCRRWARSGQAETIAWLNERELLLSNEAGKVWRARIIKKR